MSSLILAITLSLGILFSVSLLLRVFDNLSPRVKSGIYLTSLIITPLVFVISFLGGSALDPRECMSLIRRCVILGIDAFSGTPGFLLLMGILIFAASVIYSLVKNAVLLWLANGKQPNLPTFDPEIPGVPAVYLGEGADLKVTGFLKPRIVIGRELMRTLSKEKLTAVILHEYHHLKTGDNLFRLLAMVIRDAFFWVPPVIIFFNAYLAEREKAADEFAARFTGKPRMLAETILELWGKGLALPRFAPQSSFLTEVNEQRIQQLLRRPHPPGNARLAAVLAGLILMVFVAAAFVFPARGFSDTPSSCHQGGQCGMTVKGACCPR